MAIDKYFSGLFKKPMEFLLFLSSYNGELRRVVSQEYQNINNVTNTTFHKHFSKLEAIKVVKEDKSGKIQINYNNFQKVVEYLLPLFPPYVKELCQLLISENLFNSSNQKLLKKEELIIGRYSKIVSGIIDKELSDELSEVQVSKIKNIILKSYKDILRKKLLGLE